MSVVFCLARWARSPTDSAVPIGGMGLFSAAEIQWGDGTAVAREGAQMAVLEGDPAKEGMFTMRLKLPADFDVKPHWHTQVEHVTVISGTLHFGWASSSTARRRGRCPRARSATGRSGMRHFAYTEGETVLQLHGRGPWTITYVNPADDPRGRK